MKSCQRIYLLTVFFVSILVFGQSLADLNGDGIVDAVIANNKQKNQICLGDGSGGFSCSDVSAATARSLDVSLGDVNGDGNLDAVFANYKGKDRVCLGDGTGGFSCSDVSGFDLWSRGVALADLNNDGDLDAVFANDKQNDQICLGDGSGGFSCSDVSADTARSLDVSLGDVNGDGDLDAVFAIMKQKNQVCLGDGTGGFSCSDVNGARYKSKGVALADLNNDGDLDAVFVNDSGPERDEICLGDGAGGFVCTEYKLSYRGKRVELGDLDDDGDPDAVLPAYNQNNPVCLGDGTGGFLCSNVSVDFSNSMGVALADLNNDGDLDAVFVNDSQEDQSCLGDGAGGFSCTDISADTNAGRSVALSPINPTGMWDPTVGSPGTNGEVWDIAKVNGEIYAAGRFSSVSPDSGGGALAVNGVARWTGVAWEAAIATDNLESFSIVRSVIEFDGQLVIGGNLQSLAGEQSGVFVLKGNQWEPLGGTTAWETVPGVLLGQVFKLTVIDDVLYAGGGFIRSGCKHICKYSAGGTWETVGNTEQLFDRPNRVYDLQTHKDKLYAAGDFLGGVRILDGATWNIVGDGFFSQDVHTLEVLDGKLYAGGNFTISVPGNAYSRIAMLNDTGDQWQQVLPIPNQNVWDLRGIQCDGNPFLLAFGGFTSPGAHAAEYDLLAGTATELDGGLTFTSPSSQVRVATCSTPLCNDSVFVGGLFDGAGIHPVGNIAEYVLPPGCGSDNTKTAFVTGGAYFSNLGGLTGADLKCQAESEAPGSIVPAGTYKAWLSNDTDSPDTRFTKSSSPYVRSDGVKIANNYVDLTDGALLTPIDKDQFGVTVSQTLTWTNTDASGFIASATGHCENWESNVSTFPGRYGRVSQTNSLWTSDSDGQCGNGLALYCFEQ